MTPGLRAFALVWHSVRALASATTLLALATGVSGCWAGTVGAILGIKSLIDAKGSGSTDSQPQVTQFEAAPQGSRDRILITFTLYNEDRGILGAQIQYVEVTASGSDGPALEKRRAI